MRFTRAIIFLSLTAVCTAQSADYLRDIKPVLKTRCYACHDGLKQKAGLRLDTAEHILQGSKDGNIIIPKNPAKSLILKKITASKQEDRMPPEGEPLSPKQIESIRNWIEAGAPVPKVEASQVDPRDHWSFQPIKRPLLPQKTANPIDAFINDRLEKKGIKPLPPADSNTLLRRVYIDLTGLPPTREQLHDFQKTSQSNHNAAFENLVDQLLASPQYGERWGRHWMDVWRYSDWYGRRAVNDVRNSYPHIWRWRDWIINSMNDDKGYDRMIMEMLAADEIAPEDDKAIAATGFIVRNWYSLNYNTWMQNQVEHTGKAFLGLTFNCALCHDHKYDPISQKEYFAFRAFFEPLEFRHDRIPGGPNVPKYVRYKPGSGASLKPIASGLPRVFDEMIDAKTRIYEGADYRALTDDPPVKPAAPVFLVGDKLKIIPRDLPLTAWYPGRKKFIQEAELTQAQKNSAAAKTSIEKNATVLNSARQTTTLAQAESIRARIAADNARGTDKFESKALAAYRVEQLANLHAANEMVAKAHQAINSTAKDADKKKAKDQLASAQKSVATAQSALSKQSPKYTLFSPTYPKKSSGRRTALAKWITNSENPLTARVAANHIWARHFRQPLAEPVYDLGRKGSLPSHPKLLDYLASELIKNNWRMKSLHRLIVTSEAYKRSSVIPNLASQTSYSKDADNKLLWRMNSGRAEAEVIRDSILHVAGSLDKTIGGPEIDAKKAPASTRRALYFTIFPEDGGHTQFIALFDAPDPCDCYRRSTSIIPQQALAMANSKLAQDQSRILAKKMWASTGKETAFVTAIFEQILTRLPEPKELELCLAFLTKQKTLLKNNNKSMPDQRARESLVHSLFSHNDFITAR